MSSLAHLATWRFNGPPRQRAGKEKGAERLIRLLNNLPRRREMISATSASHATKG
jgi:hypothetical protein